MLSMNNVYFSYRRRGTPKDVLTNVSISFDAGKIYAIYGPSGAGKTTCLSLLGGLDCPSKGQIKMDGKDIKTIGYSEWRKRYVSFVFQDYHLFPYMTAIENVAVAASITQKISQKEIKQEAIELLQMLGIDEETMNRPVSQISGGQQQRVAIVRALIKNPIYILADEPTGNLDKDNAEMIIEILTKLAREHNKCIIIATHSDLVCAHADVTMKMTKGKLLMEEKGCHTFDN